ncbi:Pep3/Vps18/deep orange family-domain-containing protein [Zopfochytrium polystomum]|nr:Pep3/Vps18/deep orange family-domain-containing protein [Zopfochytrium polystomum]
MSFLFEQDVDDAYGAGQAALVGSMRASLGGAAGAGAAGGGVLGQPRGPDDDDDGDDGATALAPMFALDRVQFSFPGTLICVAVSSNWLAIVLEAVGGGGSSARSQTLLRIDLGQSQAIEEIDVLPKQKNDRVRKVFLNPSASHILLATELGDSYYLHKSWKKPRYLPKFRGVMVESVAWAPSLADDPSTGVFLVGSRQGHVFEAELSASDEFFKKEERHFKQVFSIFEDDMPITGLVQCVFPSNTKRRLVLASTPGRLYHFLGAFSEPPPADSGYFGGLFNNSGASQNYQELSDDDGLAGFLGLWGSIADSVMLSSKFALLTTPGIYHGALNMERPTTVDAVLPSPMLLPFPTVRGATAVPLQLAQTGFHYLLLYENCVRAVSELTGDLVYEERIPLDYNEKILGMVSDDTKQTYWIFTTNVLYELIVTDEDRGLWRFYLEKSNFEKARSYAKTDKQRDKIVTKQGEHYFSEKMYQQAADCFAQSQSVGFEDVVLRLIDSGDVESLRVFLMKKLGKLSKTSQVQIFTISMWLVEIFVNLLNNEESAGSTSSTTKQEFYQFLRQYKDKLDIPGIYKLLSSHGRMTDFLFLAELVGDKDSVVGYWIQERKWGSALTVLSQSGTLDLYYKYASVLLENSPEETVTLWTRSSNLNPRALIPAMMKYEAIKNTRGLTMSPVIRYLLHVVEIFQNTDPVVHNYIVSLFVTYAKSDKEETLLRFLSSQREDPYFDPRYALRLCLREGLTQSCIVIYSIMGMHEQAVELALRLRDFELAQIQADKPTDDDTLRKRLWLRIARSIVEEKNDIKQAMSFIQNCELLKFEDILPFFPDFVHIAEFKDELSNALTGYKERLAELTQDMNEATKSAENIRVDLRELKTRYSVVPMTEKCCICSHTLLTRQFYVFPCHHVFHGDCLIREVADASTPSKRRRITDLAASLRRDALAPPQSAPYRAKQAEAKAELDDLISAECLFCGDMMIRSVTKPFVDARDADEMDKFAL